MAQLENTVKPEMMFNENYHFISSTSKTMAEHFRQIAQGIIQSAAGKKDFLAVELGCNDGIMLRHVAAAGIGHVGIEPSANVARLARENGITVEESFFNRQTALKIAQKYGKADIICGSNVMCHIEDINSVFEGTGALLKDDGALFFEDPYLGDIIRKSSFDQIYDEHVYYFCGLSVSELAKRHSLKLVDMLAQDVHGGSMRYYIKKIDSRAVDKRVKEYLSQEKSLGLDEIEGYLTFKDNVDRICRDLKDTLTRLKNEDKRIAGYGATSKSTTLLNYAGIGPQIIDYISDITPTKIDKFTPGVHIPVKSHDYFLKDNVPYMLLLAWNHKAEILKKEDAYRKKGGKFITYFPKVFIE
jgi:methylation protein EvaC